MGNAVLNSKGYLPVNLREFSIQDGCPSEAVTVTICPRGMYRRSQLPGNLNEVRGCAGVGESVYAIFEGSTPAMSRISGYTPEMDLSFTPTFAGTDVVGSQPIMAASQGKIYLIINKKVYQANTSDIYSNQNPEFALTPFQTSLISPSGMALQENVGFLWLIDGNDLYKINTQTNQVDLVINESPVLLDSRQIAATTKGLFLVSEQDGHLYYLNESGGTAALQIVDSSNYKDGFLASHNEYLYLLLDGQLLGTVPGPTADNIQFQEVGSWKIDTKVIDMTISHQGFVFVFTEGNHLITINPTHGYPLKVNGVGTDNLIVAPNAYTLLPFTGPTPDAGIEIQMKGADGLAHSNYLYMNWDEAKNQFAFYVSKLPFQPGEKKAFSEVRPDKILGLRLGLTVVDNEWIVGEFIIDP